MIVGLSDGSVELFRLFPRNTYLYYEHIKTMNTHEDAITGLHLDRINKVVYSASVDGFLNVSDARNGVLINSLELNTEITGIYGDENSNKLILALGEGNMEIYTYD